MKRSIFIALIPALLIAASALSQELIRNPAKPPNPEAGRVIKLEPIFEIKDEPGKFYFKYPYRFDLDPQGFFYVLDQDQLLKFSPEGRFVGNLWKKGQGPGEIASSFQMVSFFCDGAGLYVYDGIAKIIHLDAGGKLLDEVKQAAGRFFELMGTTERGFLMRGQTNVPFEGGAGFREIETSIHLVSPDGRAAEKIIGFASRIYQGSNFGMDWDGYWQAFDRTDGSLYVSQTCEYKILRAHLLDRMIAAAFTRDYPRVPFVIPEYAQDFYKRHNPPKKDYANDIAALFPGGGRVWVQTSTSAKGKGALFDLFDPQGRFLDSFFLGEGLNLALARGDFIYVTEKDEEDNISVKKLRILDGAKFP